MTAKPPRKRAAKKTAHARIPDDPQTPFYDARNDGGEFAVEDFATTPDNPATEFFDARDDAGHFAIEEAKTPQPVPQPEPHTEPARATYVRCVNCGDPAVYETDGRATTKRGYCQRELPANVTQAMVEQYQRLSRQ